MDLPMPVMVVLGVLAVGLILFAVLRGRGGKSE